MRCHSRELTHQGLGSTAQSSWPTPRSAQIGSLAASRANCSVGICMHNYRIWQSWVCFRHS